MDSALPFWNVKPNLNQPPRKLKTMFLADPQVALPDERRRLALISLSM
jgi:hypothetical protein